MHWLHARVIFPAAVLARGEGSVFRRLREMRTLQWLSTEALLTRQDAQLAEILRHAAFHVPFHRARLRGLAPFHADQVRKRLKDIPLLTKADLQEHQQALLAQPRMRRVTKKTTGGSTGQAVTLVKNREATAAEMASSFLGYSWFGIDFGDRAARFWGSPATFKRRLRSAAADLVTHRVRFSAFAFDDRDLERYWLKCLSFRPAWFYGYVSMLEAFAQFVARRGYDGRSLELKAIVTTAEVLSEPQRRLLADTFGARVQNEYGCGEVGPVAYECDRGQLHLMTEGQIVEILKPDGTDAAIGETGQVVVTDLHNFAMPLIRYRLGDLAVPGPPCVCGRGFPVLERVWGRAYDFVEAPDGRRYHGEFFMYMFEDLRSRGLGVGQFQVAQRDSDTLEVRVVATGSAASETVNAAIIDIFRARLPGMRVTVRAVPAIAPQPSGKQLVIANEWSRPDRSAEMRGAR